MEISIQYLAGLFDGEGTVTLTSKHRGEYRAPTLSVSSTTPILLEVFKNRFGGSISTQKVYQSHHKPAWSWKVNYDKAILTCEELLPHILEPEKLRRMKLIINNYKSVTIRNGQYTEQQRRTKLAFETEFFHPSNAVVVRP